MQTVHPRPVGNRMTVLVNYHGSDTYRFSSTELDKVENVGRFGDRRRFKSLALGIRSIFSDGETTPIIVLLARLIDAGSVLDWEAYHMAKRLHLENIDGLGDLKLSSLQDLPDILTKRGVKVW